MKIEKQTTHDRWLATIKELLHEQHAVALMREDIAFLIGCISREQPATAERLEQILNAHTEKKRQLNGYA